MYTIDFDPPVYFKICGTIINNLKDELGAYVFDGKSSIYLLNEPRKTTFSTALRSGDKYTLRFTFRRNIEYNEANYFQILNLVIRQSLQDMNLKLIGRNYFDPKESLTIHGAKLQIWPGFATAIRKYEKSLLLCCDFAHKIIREESVLDILRDCQRSSRDDNQYHIMAKRRLVGITVISVYNNMNYRVDDIDFRQSPNSTFELNGKDKTFIEYFAERYNIHIRDNRQPLLISKPKAKDRRGGRNNTIVLIPELCSPVGVTDEMRNDFGKMRDLADKTRMTPAQRVERLFNFNKRLKSDGAQSLNANQLSVDDRLVEFDGRKLPEQKIIFGRTPSGEVKVVDLKSSENIGEWKSSLKDIVMYKPMAIERWIFIYPQALERQSQTFLEKFIQAGEKLGMQITNPKKAPLANDRPECYVDTITTYLKKDCEFLLIVVPNINCERYRAIKETSLYSFQFRPTPTQVITLKVMDSKAGLSVATNVAIQVNCKLGGIPWSINIPFNGLLTIGFSITNDTKDKKVVYGAMVASMNPGKSNGTFFSCVNKHSKGSNCSDYFSVNISKIIDQYKKTYQALPERIIIYRDGVGEGQIQYVVGQELEDVKSSLNRHYSKCQSKPKLAFIIINKKINTRIFSQERNSYDNPLPGTVVDDVITLPERYDFYLISQSVKQGTVAPTSYNIIYDTSRLKPKEIQLLSYQLCHLYYNWSGTTRVPAVVQYAQKLAFMFGQYLHLHDSTEFEKMKSHCQLYFL
ncbi:protein aubergine-like [Chironomus tepperi]|uniref:protein aubergine-like n=1 Tax=Chironomus tepperi TaxID=113505 RepID=UPI00391FB0A1